ncbi:cytochrome b/b6 domain-containing protein (plasmid) [Pseudanabaena biceps]|nr:cytochrome b/b6 domain-containing protein [Pseudanabaena biceps]
MSQTKPYQPLAFRLLHGMIGVLILIAIATGVLIYNVYDGRIGHLPIPTVPKIMGIHKLFGRIFLLGMPIFALYSFHEGRRRLLQSDSIQQMSKVGNPIWWYTLHRAVNTFLLVGATFALVSGREMNEGWMSRGELTELWYSLHLASWAIMVVCIMAHLLMSIRVGGVPLLLSILHLRYRSYDRFSLLIQSIRSWLSPKWIMTFLKAHLSLHRHNFILLSMELLVMLGTLFALLSLIPHRGA